MLFYEGEKFSIEGTQDAEASLQDVQNHASDSCIAQLWRLIERLADAGKLRSPDQFNHEGDGIYAVKAKCGLRAYGWYHLQRRGVFVISHFKVKKKQKLNPVDRERALKNRAQYEGEQL